MPLLGRHKSSTPSPPAAGANNYQQQQQQPTATGSSNSRQQLCESPLFGIRRQLPSTVLDGTSNNNNNDLVSQRTGSSKQQQQQQLQQQQQQQQQQSQSVNSTGLSSIPQQITRQQIHYAFSIMDTNKDGQVDVRDLSQMLSNLGVPIDEAILSHIMRNTVSKRGDHRISEAEFLDWISHFIEIRSESAPKSGQQQQRGGAGAGGPTKSNVAVRATRSSAAGSSSTSSLVAQASEMPRARRGSGSGLALMRSLSSSSASSSSSNTNKPAEHTQSCSDKKASSSSSSSSSPANSNSNSNSKSKCSKPALEQQSSTDSTIEAKNDLKAAFCVFDLDGDGFITLDEVRAGLKLLGESWSPVELRRLFSRCNGANNNPNSPTSDLSKQRISIDDFVQLLL